MNRNYDYALLGFSCHTNSNELIDNRKFFSINNSIYKPSFTNMYRYPGGNYNITATIPELDYPEQLKVNGNINFDIQKKKEDYKNYNYSKGCCGN